MSDSDDDFDLDFVNQATIKVKNNWSSKVDLKDVTNTMTEEGDEIPTKRKKGKISGFMDSPTVTKKAVTVNKSYNDSEDDDDEIKVKEKIERPPISLTPPGSPAASPEKKSARGTRRTKKTEQALKKLQKTKGSDTALRFRQLPVLDTHEDTYRPRPVPSEQTFELKIRWKMKILRFTVKPQDRMSHVVDLVAKETGVAAKDLNIYKDDTCGVPFALEKTVQALQLSVVSLLSARAKVVSVDDDDGVGGGSGDGSIEVKLQTKDRRAQPVLVRIHLTDKMQTVIDKFFEQTKIDKDKIKVFFEGEQLNPDDLASDLDLEGGECFDVHINDK